MDWLIDPFFYNWLILAIILLIVEVATFTLLFLWLGIAALIMVVITWAFPDLSMPLQLLLFAILSLLSVVMWSLLFKKRQAKSGSLIMNNRAQRYVGRTTVLIEPIDNGRGKVQLDDSYWRVESSVDLPIDTKIRVVGCRGTTLLVEAAD